MRSIAKRIAADEIVQRLAVLAAVLGLVFAALTAISGGAEAMPPSVSSAADASVGAPAATGADGLTETKTLSRTFYPGGGDQTTVDNKIDVTLDRHTNIQANERIHITWTGAHPTGARASNPYGSSGMQQEYPVVIMECRGAPSQVTQQTCWTQNFQERTQRASNDRAGDNAVWLDDADNVPGVDDQDTSGLTPDQLAKNPCPVDSTVAIHITPFVAKNGTTYYNCSEGDMAPEEADDSTIPAQEISAFTNAQGSGSADFEVRTDTQNESLGCSATVACSIVVIPIEGLSCADPTKTNCNSVGNYAPGVYSDGSTGSAPAVSAALWWSPSNWSQRFVFPITIAEPPSVCSISNTAGSPVPFYGSELLSQAALQWTPSYCLNKNRFNWQDNVMSDDASFGLMQNGSAVAAEVSGRRDNDDHVAYAPTAVTGWGIAFDIDTPTGSQQMSLKLNARLLAKLLTESYSGGGLGVQRPGLANNPYSLNMDPEFQALNPGLDQRHWSEAASTLLAVSTSSDVMEQLTSYIAADKDAMDFIHGKADPWGMTVNPAYKNMSLPVSTWPLLDTWVPTTTDKCRQANVTAYMPLIAEPTSSLRLVSQAMLYNWPNVNTNCASNTSTNPPSYTIGRVGQQGIGSRFMLGLVDLGDAARYGLPLASLETTSGSYVAPTNTSMAAAVKLAKPGKKLKPFSLDEETLRKSAAAYPGTMVVYTAAKTTGLAKASAQHVAQFIQVSSTEGQVQGRGNGQLPSGYLPITKSGATAGLYTAAQAARKAILAQKAPATPPVSPPSSPSSSPSTPSPSSAPAAPPPSGAPSAPPSAPAPSSVGPSASSPSPSSTTPTTEVPLAKTAAVTSNWGGSLLPVLFAIGLIAIVATLIMRIVLLMKGARR
jgi:hypothetical protein